MKDPIIVAVFPSRSVLLTALDYLMEEAASDIQKAAVIAKSKTGEILVLDDALGAEGGGVVGGLVGALVMAVGFAALGVWTLPALNLLLVLGLGLLSGGLVGWIVGSFVGRTVNFGFARTTIDALATRLQEGKPALMLRARDAARLLPRLKEHLKEAELIEALTD